MAMMARYILKSFVRHKGRTSIIVLALLIVTVMLMILNNAVESLQQQDVKFVERDAGEHDVTITRAETSPDQLIDVEHISALLRDADPTVTAIYPRFHAQVELQNAGQTVNALLVARTPADDLPSSAGVWTTAKKVGGPAAGPPTPSDARQFFCWTLPSLLNLK